MAKNAKKANWRNWLLNIGVCAALVLSAGTLIRVVSNEKTKELPSYSYSIGAVTNEGKLDSEDKTSMTSEKLNVKDLVSIEVAEDAKVQVFVHYYTKDGDFLSSVELSGELGEAPQGAETFRVEIVPTDDDDGKIGAFEKGDYAKMVTVTLKK